MSAVFLEQHTPLSSTTTLFEKTLKRWKEEEIKSCNTNLYSTQNLCISLNNQKSSLEIIWCISSHEHTHNKDAWLSPSLEHMQHNQFGILLKKQKP